MDWFYNLSGKYFYLLNNYNESLLGGFYDFFVFGLYYSIIFTNIYLIFKRTVTLKVFTLSLIFGILFQDLFWDFFLIGYLGSGIATNIVPFLKGINTDVVMYFLLNATFIASLINLIKNRITLDRIMYLILSLVVIIGILIFHISSVNMTALSMSKKIAEDTDRVASLEGSEFTGVCRFFRYECHTFKNSEGFSHKENDIEEIVNDKEYQPHKLRKMKVFHGENFYYTNPDRYVGGGVFVLSYANHGDFSNVVIERNRDRLVFENAENIFSLLSSCLACAWFFGINGLLAAHKFMFLRRKNNILQEPTLSSL